MKTIRVLFQMARADFLERTRRYSFLILSGLVVYLGYLCNSGQITLRLGAYRGVFNSAWVGSMMALVIVFFLGLFGFYLVNDSIKRDEQTRVGQIIATTPISRPMYTIGKWLSNFVLLSIMVFVLAIAAVFMQVLQHEAPVVEFGALLAPLVFVALPMMALVAAMAVLFESIPWLSGGLGNVVYFFLFLFVQITGLEYLSAEWASLDPTGIKFFMSEMTTAANNLFGDYQGDFTLNVGGTHQSLQVFDWEGVVWDAGLIAQRLIWIVVALGIAALAALFFNRFDPAKRKLPKEKEPFLSKFKLKKAIVSEIETCVIEQDMGTAQLTPLKNTGQRFRFFSTFRGELMLLLKGRPWWWWAIWGVLLVVQFTVQMDSLQEVVLPLAFVWPLLVWSDLGCRAARTQTESLVFCAPRPIARQLPAAWLAGLVFTATCGAGIAFRWFAAGNTAGLIAWTAAVVFIPSLALGLGTLSASNKVFEVVYVVLWYIGPMSRFQPLDFLGTTGENTPSVYLLIALGMMLAAVLGQLRRMKQT